MTLQTCYKRLELSKTDKEKKFWEDRIARKIARFPDKYAQIKEESKDGKKSKR